MARGKSAVLVTANRRISSLEAGFSHHGQQSPTRASDRPITSVVDNSNVSQSGTCAGRTISRCMYHSESQRWTSGNSALLASEDLG